MSIRHNTEGIVLASNLDTTETRNDLKNATLEKLVEEGKALINVQNWWFGNGSFAGIKPELIKKVLYKSENGISSGWLKGDSNHSEFMNSLTPLLKLMYPIWNAVYKMSDAEFAGSVWGQKGITKSDLKSSLSSDGNAVNNSVWSLMKDGKINYSLVGSWDILNVQKTANAKSFFIVPELRANDPYLQAPGFWSYLINVRNIQAVPDRKQAFKEFLKCVFSNDAYFEYFKSDAKVPFVKAAQEAVEAKQNVAAQAIREEFRNFIKELGWVKKDEGSDKEVADVNSFLTEYKKSIQPYDVLTKYVNQQSTWGKDGYKATDPQNPLDPSYIISHDKWNQQPIEGILSQEDTTKLNESFGDGLPLKNALATIFNTTMSNIELSPERHWLINNNLLRVDAKTNEPVYLMKDPENPGLLKYRSIINSGDKKEGFHMRLVEKLIFGVDGDNTKEAFLNRLTNIVRSDDANQQISALIEKSVKDAKEFAQGVLKSFPKENTPEYTTYQENLKKAITLYLNDYLNDAKIRAKGQELLDGSPMLNAKGEATKYTKVQVIDRYNEYDRTFAINKLFDVLTSEKSLEDNGLGVFKTQEGIINNYNPQYGDVWGAWNEQTMGNLEFLKDIQANNEQEFKKAIEEKLNTQFKTLVEKVNKSDVGVTLDWGKIQSK
ncbi:hypothetical protein GE118_00230 [Mycoplasma sp. NEAQ87857]|uniref:hypothetical protein n=1 Tax=Mycoplasma sp. NEAQ87857 TaxID=2683967 RepID=UPI00131713A6|nr:hypothetical protein [Mycoplasma sp. NEAQ87857]QGZ97230.1 hypothetical protein GE118_00230 [Mycoplasma sp. NEAQ87857]